MATKIVHNGIDNSYLYIDYSFSVSGRNWTCTASLKLQMGSTYNFDAWTSSCGNSATLRKDGGTMPGGGRPLKNNTYTLDGPKQVGSGTYDAAGNAPSVNVSWAWNVNSSWGSYVCPHGTATLTGSSIGPAYSNPTCSTPVISEVTPSTVKGTFAVTNWGGTGAGYIAARLFGASGSARLENQFNGQSSVTTTITNSSVALDGGIIIKGAATYYADTYGKNTADYSSNSSRVTVYTPPAALDSITYTQTQNSTNVTVNATITGGSSSVNSSNTVTTYWRYSTDGGSTWSGWGNAGDGTAYTAKNVSFNCNYGASVKIQAYQSYQSKNSDTKEVSFTATNGTAPSGGTLTVDSSTWNSITLTAAGVSYGKPDGISGRKLSIGVHAYDDNTTKRENQVENVTGATTTVDNNSIYPSGTALQLKGMTPVYPYIWAWNTKQSTYVVNETAPYYLPPAPGVASYTEDGNDEYTISFTGAPANNYADYTVADLTRTVRYKIDGGSWVYVDNDAQKALDTVTSETITVNPQHNATVESWLTYKGKESTHNTFMIVNSNDPIFLYGSVNGETKKIRHFYGSVNGETKKIVKMYGSVGGVARKVFEDV